MGLRGKERGNVKVRVKVFHWVMVLVGLVLVQIVLQGPQFVALDFLDHARAGVEPLCHVLILHIGVSEIHIDVVMGLFEVSIFIHIQVMENIGVLFDGFLALQNLFDFCVCPAVLWIDFNI